MNYLSTMSDIPEFATTVLESGQFYVPRPLMEHCLPEFGANGVIAYALLLDRLRKPIDFIYKGRDDEGNIFIYFSNEDLAEALNCSKTTVISVKKILAQKHLIVEVKQGLGQPNRIYLTDEILSYY